MSLDAKIALSDGRSKWITSEKSRQTVQKMRAASDAIITGSGTVIADNPLLNVRYDELSAKVFEKYDINKEKQPLRVVLDSRQRINPDDYVMFSQGKVLLVRPSLGSKNISEQINEHLEIFYAPCDFAGKICISAVLSEFVAPKVLGVNAKTAFACDEVSSLDCLKPYKILTIKRSGKDFFVRALLA